MGTIRKTITVTQQQNKWIKTQIENGDYTNDSEYIRDLIRKDQESHADFLALKAELQKGLDSGVSNRTFDEIWKEGRQEALKKVKHAQV